MRMQPDTTSESRLAAGLKAAALIVLLGLIAVVSEPMLHSSAAMDDALLPSFPVRTSTAAPASAGDGPTYFPSQYPAPTNVEEQPQAF
ncbi:MAG TPA: hypothetical protein VMB76_08735 [Casimicrobiaceae bacterium]|jgi:hypothetical protein|nr:hypothetical protein [Casimicrobiaceae bacterium]